MAGIDRQFAMHHGLPEVQLCDRCDAEAEGLALIVGSRAGVLGFCDAAGITVHRREALESGMVEAATEQIPAKVSAQRAVFLCGECAAAADVPLGACVVEPGYEDAFRAAQERLNLEGDG